MKKSKKKQRIVYVIGVVVFLIFTLGPFVWAFFVSITPEFEMFKNTTSMLPKQITWDNYRRILESGTRQHEVVFDGGRSDHGNRASDCSGGGICTIQDEV